MGNYIARTENKLTNKFENFWMFATRGQGETGFLFWVAYTLISIIVPMIAGAMLIDFVNPTAGVSLWVGSYLLAILVPVLTRASLNKVSVDAHKSRVEYRRAVNLAVASGDHLATSDLKQIGEQLTIFERTERTLNKEEKNLRRRNKDAFKIRLGDGAVRKYRKGDDMWRKVVWVYPEEHAEVEVALKHIDNARTTVETSRSKVNSRVNELATAAKSRTPLRAVSTGAHAQSHARVCELVANLPGTDELDRALEEARAHRQVTETTVKNITAR